MTPRPSPRIILVAHNLRSTHNVGSLLRTADGLGVERVILSGYTPYPLLEGADDDRLPHIAVKLDAQINKTALGAARSVDWSHESELLPVIAQLRSDGWLVAAIEQAADSVSLPDYQPPEKLVLIVGREVEGIEHEVLAACDAVLEIPMSGRKESFNVAQAAAMALYHCRYLGERA